MKKIRDATTIIGLIGDGDLATELSDEMTGLLAALHEHCGGRKKSKAKGSLTLKLDVVVEDGMVSITPDVAVKKPKKLRGDGVFWVDSEGSLSTEHPSQMRLDLGPSAVAATTTALA